MVNKAQLPLFDDKGRPFGHFERGITYTAKRLNIGILVKKNEPSNLEETIVFKRIKNNGSISD
ncbi:hypothetical protein NGF69_16675 [Enterococcus casseliflavus]|nr:hypothetical protein [Enterococcus casseliflavus]